MNCFLPEIEIKTEHDGTGKCITGEKCCIGFHIFINVKSTFMKLHETPGGTDAKSDIFPKM
jgi:hypothetical protein